MAYPLYIELWKHFIATLKIQFSIIFRVKYWNSGYLGKALKKYKNINSSSSNVKFFKFSLLNFLTFYEVIWRLTKKICCRTTFCVRRSELHDVFFMQPAFGNWEITWQKLSEKKETDVTYSGSLSFSLTSGYLDNYSGFVTTYACIYIYLFSRFHNI